MALKRYRVILTSRSSLKAGIKRDWKNPEYHMLIRDDLQKDAGDGPPRHAGLIYTVEVSAEHIVESIHKAVSYVRHVTDQISAIHGVAIEYPVPLFSIDIEKAYSHRELAQVLYNVPALHQPRRTHDSDLYKNFYYRLDELRQYHPKSAKRIDRALHYLRSSYIEQEPIDRFEDAWVALENINPLIREKYAQPTTYQRKCPKCKENLSCWRCNVEIKEPDNASGIDYIVTQLLQETLTMAMGVREKRLDIVHARTSFSTIMNDINPKTRLAQRAVMAGVLDILGIPKEQGANFLREMLPLTGAQHVTVSAILYDLPVESLGTRTKYPQLFLQSCEKEVQNRQEVHAGEICPIAAQLNIGIQNFSGTWDLLEVSLLLETDPDNKDSAIQIIARKVSGATEA